MTERKVPLGTLTTPSTAITKEAVLDAAEGSLTLRFEYDRNGVIYSGGLEFRGVRAYRYRAESHCTAWHIEGVYDTVAEVEASEWIAELSSVQSEEMRGLFEMHHYMLFIDGSGCFEVVGSAWSLLPDIRVA